MSVSLSRMKEKIEELENAIEELYLIYYNAPVYYLRENAGDEIYKLYREIDKLNSRENK